MFWMFCSPYESVSCVFLIQFLMPSPPFPPLALAVWVVSAAADTCRVDGSGHLVGVHCGRQGQGQGGSVPNGALLLTACSDCPQACAAS